jgi:FtsP/CotA-like multicopper oxidase with cupredoxin domain
MTNERLRCRLVNATKSKVTRLRFDRHPIRVMAIDGQPAEPFLARDGRIALGPGNRIDVFVDAVLEPGATGSIFLDESGGEKEFARLVYDPAEKRRAASLADPKPLPPNPLPDRIDLRNALRIEAPLGPDSQNPAWRKIAAPFGQFGSSLFSVKRGRAVVMAFPNQTDAAHVIHLHGHCARLLDNLDDGWKPFWLDTILVDARKTARIAFVADNPGQWLIERQAIGQDGAGLTAWFEVV